MPSNIIDSSVPLYIIQPYWHLPSVYVCRRAKVRPLVADSQFKTAISQFRHEPGTGLAQRIPPGDVESLELRLAMIQLCYIHLERRQSKHMQRGRKCA